MHGQLKNTDLNPDSTDSAKSAAGKPTYQAGVSIGVYVPLADFN